MLSSFVKTEDFYIEKHTLIKPMTEMHFHNSHEIYFLIKGAREYFIEDSLLNLKEGDLVLVPRDVLHRTAGKGAMRILLFFTDEYLLRFFSPEVIRKVNGVFSVPLYRLSHEDVEWLSGILHRIWTEYEQPPSGTRDEVMIAALLFQVLWRLSESRNLFSPDDEGDPRIKEIVKYINENFSSIDSIDQIAETFFFSKYYLCQLFKKNVGITLFTYLNTVKIQYACSLLKEGRSNMTEISLACGFNTPSYFCKVFHTVMGISPSEYRRRAE